MSIHAIVKINAPDGHEYERRVKLVRSLFGEEIDSTQDAVGFTRLPNSRYNKNGVTGRTRLLSMDIGAESYEAWEETAEFDDGMPEIQRAAEFLASRMELDPYLIHGLLRQKSKMAITSALFHLIPKQS